MHPVNMLPHIRWRSTDLALALGLVIGLAASLAVTRTLQSLLFEISAFDIQPALIASARSGRLTFGYPEEYLATPGRVAPSVIG